MFNEASDQIIVVLNDLERLHTQKQRAYGASWCKWGELSVLFNLSRKVDRLEVIVTKGTPSVGETMLDTLADLAVYGMLYYSYLCKTHTEPDENIHRICAQVAETLAMDSAPLAATDWHGDWQYCHDQIMGWATNMKPQLGMWQRAELAKKIATAAVAKLVLASKRYAEAYAVWGEQWYDRAAAPVLPMKMDLVDHA